MRSPIDGPAFIPLQWSHRPIVYLVNSVMILYSHNLSLFQLTVSCRLMPEYCYSVLQTLFHSSCYCPLLLHLLVYYNALPKGLQTICMCFLVFLMQISDAKGLFMRLEEKGLLENNLFLSQLLETIQRPDLLSLMETDNSQSEETDACPLLSNYR